MDRHKCWNLKRRFWSDVNGKSWKLPTIAYFSSWQNFSWCFSSWSWQSLLQYVTPKQDMQSIMLGLFLDVWQTRQALGKRKTSFSHSCNGLPIKIWQVLTAFILNFVHSINLWLFSKESMIDASWKWQWNDTVSNPRYWTSFYWLYSLWYLYYDKNALFNLPSQPEQDHP